MWCPVFVALKFCCFHIKCCLSTEVCAHFLRIKAKLRKQKITLCMLQQWRRRTCLKCASSPELFRKKKMRFLFLHRRICLCLIFSSFSSFVSLQDKRTKENAYKSYFLLLSWEQWVKNIPLRKKNNIRFFFFGPEIVFLVHAQKQTCRLISSSCFWQTAIESTLVQAPSFHQPEIKSPYMYKNRDLTFQQIVYLKKNQGDEKRWAET